MLFLSRSLRSTKLPKSWKRERLSKSDSLTELKVYLEPSLRGYRVPWFSRYHTNWTLSCWEHSAPSPNLRSADSRLVACHYKALVREASRYFNPINSRVITSQHSASVTTCRMAIWLRATISCVPLSGFIFHVWGWPRNRRVKTGTARIASPLMMGRHWTLCLRWSQRAGNEGKVLI